MRYQQGNITCSQRAVSSLIKSQPLLGLQAEEVTDLRHHCTRQLPISSGQDRPTPTPTPTLGVPTGTQRQKLGCRTHSNSHLERPAAPPQVPRALLAPWKWCIAIQHCNTSSDNDRDGALGTGPGGCFLSCCANLLPPVSRVFRQSKQGYTKHKNQDAHSQK